MSRCTDGYVLDDIMSARDYIDLKIKRMPDDVIAVEYSVSLTTLERWKTRHQINRTLVNRVRFLIIQERLQKGDSVRAIARDFKMQPRNIYIIIRNHALDTYKGVDNYDSIIYN